MNIKSDIAAIDEGFQQEMKNFKKKAGAELDKYLSGEKLSFLHLMT